MNIWKAEFIISNKDVTKCPNDGRPDYTLIGRSNVGKSSLINMLTERKDLAMTSSTPGKTKLINHFLINDEWYLVDLPGYGYTQRSKQDRTEIQRIIDDYLLKRRALTCLFVLLDCRHEPQKIDLDFINRMGDNNVPLAIVFTKTDKFSYLKLLKNIEIYKRKLSETWEELPSIFYTSSRHNKGRNKILDYIENINRSL